MTALPQWVRPQLTMLVDAAPEGDQWLHEIKFDGLPHARLEPRRRLAAHPHRARLDPQIPGDRQGRGKPAADVRRSAARARLANPGGPT